MGPFEQFEQHLRDALNHLYDPTYIPPEMLVSVTLHDRPEAVRSIQGAILQAITDLEPLPTAPECAPSRRIHRLLCHRYVQALTQEETADRLGITPRHLRRCQWEAVNVLARHLWDQNLQQQPASSPPTPEGADTAEEEQPQEQRTPSEWIDQVKQELASLGQRAPGAVADVKETIQSVAGLGQALTAPQGINLELGPTPDELTTAIHPSVLRQALIAAIRHMAGAISSGTMKLVGERDGGQIRITISTSAAVTGELPDCAYVARILGAENGSVGVDDQEIGIELWMQLPAGDTVTVLVVDDNLDLVHFFRRYTLGTRYRIVHASEGQQVSKMIKATAPQIVVLDVMLPDVDGWELLGDLHKNPETQAIPCIICSVIREPELALALGAAVYLPKPVRRKQFIRALDQALSQAEASPTTAQ